MKNEPTKPFANEGQLQEWLKNMESIKSAVRLACVGDHMTVYHETPIGYLWCRFRGLFTRIKKMISQSLR